jgi:predicted NBD/HSP70 family sugar kinase
VKADLGGAEKWTPEPSGALSQKGQGKEMLALIDIGGTKTRVACARRGEGIGQPIVFETPRDPGQGTARILDAVKSLAGPERVEAVAVGVPGVISRDRRKLVNIPNLPQWNGASLAESFERAFDAAVVLENDTALVGLGEATAGAGRGVSIVAYVTISTGVNGARIVDGVIDRADFGFEIGEQILGVGAEAPTWEDLISGKAIARRFGRPPRELGRDHPVWEELAQIAAIGLHNTIAYWSPQRIVVGGSMMKEIGISLDSVRKRLGALRRKNAALPKIVSGALGDHGGLWGGLARLSSVVDQEPPCGSNGPLS